MHSDYLSDACNVDDFNTRPYSIQFNCKGTGASVYKHTWGDGRGTYFNLKEDGSFKTDSTHNWEKCSHQPHIHAGGDSQGVLEDPCGFGGCCWIHDGPYSNPSTGVGGCQGCNPRGSQQGWMWVK